MPKAEVYYYPTGLGHIGVNIIFSEDELDNIELPIRLYAYSKGKRSHQNIKESEARALYSIVIYVNDNDEYSIYGYKEGSWQETPLNNLSPEERTLFKNLHFTSANDLSTDWPDTIKPSHPLYSCLKQMGHHELKRKEYFFDYGGSYNFDDNWRSRGKPIRIDLPSVKKSFTDFFIALRNTDYTYTPEGFGGSSPRAYDLLNHNCAHATLNILHYAGYILEKPYTSFALPPITVAKKVSDLAHQIRPLFRKQLFESAVKNDSTQLINTLIKLSKNRLDDAIHFNYGNYIGGCSKDREYVSKIKFDGSYESIERLLAASENSSPHTAKELEECIALANPEHCLNAGIARLESVANELKYQENAGNLRKIAANLRQELLAFQKKSISHEQFSKNCSQLIDEATPILKNEHSVFTQILKNIALAICGLVAFYLMAAFINKENSGNFFFFNEPCLSKIGTHIQQNASRMQP